MVVGIDLKNTTQEGLPVPSRSWNSLAAQKHTFIITMNQAVYSTPSSTSVSQPPRGSMPLIVGSNNLTEASLFINVEAGFTACCKD